MWNLRKDTNAYSTESSAASLIGVLVVVVLAASLLSTVALFVWLAQQNASMKTFTSAVPLLPLIVVFFVIGVVLIPIALIFFNLKHNK